MLLMLIGSVTLAQTRTITGKVTSADDGSGLPGVNVQVKGTTTGTVTDVNGNFSISASDNSVLVFSFVGYATQEITVGAQSTVNVNLQSDVTALSEVVVIGYGTVNIRDATGAIASVKSEDFNKGIIASPEQLIQGKMAGVQITVASGEPGAGVNLRIRGSSSVRGGNNPLFVVDGVPLSGDNISAGGADFGRGGSSPKNPLNFINPNDIESIDVLKDASATAIYGSRGANGVVLITTKGGKGRKNSLEYSANFSVSEQMKTYDVLNAEEFLGAYEDLGGNPDLINFGSDTFWQDEINRTAYSQSHNVSYANSYKGGNYRASISYDNQEGIIKETSLERVTARLNLSQRFLDEKLKISVNSLFSNITDNAAPITNAAGFEGDLIASSIFYNPTIPNTPTNWIADRYGVTPEQYPGDAANPLSLLKYHQDIAETNRNLINVAVGYDFTSNLNFKINAGFDRSNSLRTSAMSGLQTKIGNVAGNGRAYLTDQNNNSTLLEAYLTYTKNLGKGSLNVLAGYSYQEFENFGLNANAANFGDQTNMAWMISQLRSADRAVRNYIPGAWMQYEYQEDNRLRVYDLFNPSGPTVSVYPVGTNPDLPMIDPRGVMGVKFETVDELQSFFARGTYNIGERYFFTASVRADGSSRFGPNNKYGIFPSLAAKWRMTEEGFVPELFDELALRLGWGITGNQEFGHNLYQGRQRYGGVGLNNDGSLQNQAGLVDVSFPNPDLQWEQTSQINFGVDFGFFDSKLSGSLDFYRKNTTKLLMQTFSAQPAPTPFVWENLDADVINSGIELTLNAAAIRKTDLQLDLGFNIAYNKNIVKNLAASLPTGRIHGQGLTGAYAQRIGNNQPLFAYYLRPFSGFGPDGLNKPEEDVQQFVGKSAIPKVNLGFSISLRYKAFDFATFFSGQYGHYVYNNVANAMFTKGSLGAGRNVTPDVVTSTESVGNSPDVSERFLEKGNFLRLQTLSVGYNWKFNEKMFRALRVGITGQNLLLFTNYSGLDPEVDIDKNIDGVPSLGIDYTAYPRARTVSFGLTATF